LLLSKNNALLQHLVLGNMMKEHASNASKDIYTQTDSKEEHTQGEPQFSNIIYAPVPEWRTVSGVRFKALARAVIFLIRLRKLLEGVRLPIMT
jgi:hypothetical protein